MAISLRGFLKGILLQNASDRTKQISIEPSNSATTATRTTITAAQTANRALALPDASDTLVGKATTDEFENKTMDFSSGGTNSLVADAVDILYDNTTSGLAASEVQGALDEIDAALDAHLADSSDAHDASAISNVPAGTIAATDVQTAINELDSDNQANSSALAAHLADTTDAHDASAISSIPSGNLAATDVQAALNELQSDIDGRIAGPSSATDNAIVRFDGTTGKLAQDSLVSISDVGAVTGATQLNVDNIQLNGNIVSATSGDLILDGADIDANSNRIKNVTDPSVAQDAATKAYVDSLIQGIAWKAPVKVATTANITLSGEQTIDGVLTSASRVLVKDQSTQTQNGIYVSAAGAWSRSTDMDVSSEFDSAAVFVSEGTANSDKAWVQTTDSVNLGVSNIVFTQFTSVSGGANTALSNLASVAINADLDPGVTDVREIGSSSLRFSNIWSVIKSANIINIWNTSFNSPQGVITPNGSTMPSGNSTDLVFRSEVEGGEFGITTSAGITNNAIATGTLFLETGNKTAGTGNSGDIAMYTGSSSGGTRGSITMNTNSLNVSNVTQGVGVAIWKKYPNILESAFTAAATSEDIALFTLPAKGVIHGVIIKHSAAFTGGGLASFTLSVGVAGNLTKYASAFDVFQAPGDTVGQTSSTVDFENVSTSTSIRLAAVSTGANVNAATAGTVDVYVLWGVLP